MLRTRLTTTATLATLAALILTGCTAAPGGTAESATPGASASTVTITDNFGEITVPVKPSRVVALDNTLFKTLNDWNIDLVAAPKGVMGTAWPKYVDNSDVLDIGNHREPDLEKIIEADPDLVLGGYRFGSYYEEIKKMVPATIEINPRAEEDVISELKRQTEILGSIFDRREDAAKLSGGLDGAITEAKTASAGIGTVLAVIVSGGKIGYVAPITGRSLGLLYPTLGLTPAIEQDAENTSHGDDLSPEAIAAANPDWIVVLDRDGGFGESDYVPAKDVLENAEALKNVTAVTKGQIVYADPSFYLDEGIQSYTRLFTDLGTAFSAAA
ncbi:iron ABC transporter substrate-binding protein [Mycetocola tolaasinivorans]|uniref:Iron ABC transporter substrate-binding protein n=1 Tax=Mycetocola tolaasinivorans TaxID=76635 RepID=A0A3L7A1D0_9MICO|nr:ABC transporter substrate-binding protein [Mycetocola tolaasinivorans]RLP74093.1 iron ABC transporter substrate-binding protein [Mycetocola tolaasinivorans]